MFRRNFFGAGPWDRALGLPTVRLAGAPRLGQGGSGCVVPGTGERPVFQSDPNTKVCSVSWMDTSNASYPDCVQAPPGYPGGGHNGWIPPSCMPTGQSAPPPPPTVPSCCALTWSPGQNKWLVQCNAIDERGINQNYNGDVDGLDVQKWEALCTYAPSGGCPSGQTMIADQCSPGAIACGDRLVEVDFDNQKQSYEPTGRILAEHWTQPIPSGVHIVNENDPRCLASVSSLVSTPYPAPAPAPTAAPAPTPAPGPVPIVPSTKVSPGASVPIAPGPFQPMQLQPPVPITPGRMPSAPPPVPNKSFSPSMRPSCAITPYKTRMFPTTTRETRPDQFTENQKWTK